MYKKYPRISSPVQVHRKYKSKYATGSRTYIHHARIGHINSSKILIVQSDDQLRRCQSRLEQMFPFENRHIAFQHLNQNI